MAGWSVKFPCSVLVWPAIDEVEMNDGESLRSYSETGDEKAFRDLVGRHSGMVYSTAPRRMGEAHAAEDVTQAVFCLLLRKAARLYDAPDLAACPAEVSAAVCPWLELENPLRFCAAYALALVEGERLEALLPVLADGLRDDLRQHHVLELLEQLGPAASVLAPELAELLVEAEREGLVSLRGRLVKVLASVSPESRNDWPEVDGYLRTKEEAENLERKIVDDTASIEELVAGLKHPSISWMAALTLEEMGPAAADALPGLRSALAEPDNDHIAYMAAAIKAIDPASPKPLFGRDDLLATLRGLSETVAELGPALAPSDHEAVTELIDDSQRFTPEQLADHARQLKAIHPRLRQVFVGELLKLDPALETVLDPDPSSPGH